MLFLIARPILSMKREGVVMHREYMFHGLRGRVGAVGRAW